MKILRPLLLAFAFVVACTFSTAAEITVYAAASLSDGLKEIAPLYTKATGDTLRFNFGASGALARQIKEGAPADVIFSADELRVDQLEKAGLLLMGARRTILANTLVAVVAAESGASVKTLADPFAFTLVFALRPIIVFAQVLAQVCRTVANDAHCDHAKNFHAISLRFNKPVVPKMR